MFCYDADRDQLLGRIESPKSSETGWLLLGGWPPSSCIWVYAKWKSWESSIQKWVPLNHCLLFWNDEMLYSLCFCTYGSGFEAGGSHFKPLTWSLRVKVALDAAKGLAFLHSDPVKVIYRDFKASNILLDAVRNTYSKELDGLTNLWKTFYWLWHCFQ